MRSRHSRTAGKSAYMALPSDVRFEGESAWQQVIVDQPYLAAEQKTLPVRQLALHDLHPGLDLRQCMRDDLLVGGDAERREDVPLVPDVIDHVGEVVGIDRADPLVHQRAALSVVRRQGGRVPAPEVTRANAARRACRLLATPLPARRRCP